MNALDRKMLRDLWQMRGQALAICMVMACGVAAFVMSLNMLHSLESTQERYYEDYQFPDVFAHLKRAPKSLLEQLVEIPGVSQAQARIVEDVCLDLPTLPEPAVGRLISLPERGEAMMNRLYLRRGRWLEPGRTEEVLANEAFTDAHGLHPGDRLVAIINGRRQDLRIVGVVLSPEYIYQIRPGDMLPDAKRFGVLWMNEADLAAAFDMEGAFNDLTLRIMPGASAQEVVRRVDRLASDYGSAGAYGREDQVSNVFIINELRQLRSMALIVPIIFLSVAAFLMNIVITRLIGTQREQVATLKAFGYGRLEIGWHYLKMVLVLVAVGTAIGTAAGAWMGSGLTALYTRFFHFPVLRYSLDPQVIGLGFLICAVSASLGAVGAVRRAMRQPPAEAMRPEPPQSFRPTLVERLGLQRFFSPALRMILRQMERRPMRAVLSAVVIALAVAILVVGDFASDAVQYSLDTHFLLAQRQDVTVLFAEPNEGRVVYDLTHLPGVRCCESFRNVPVRLRFGPRSRRMGIQGVAQQGELNRLIDNQQHRIALPAEGLVLSRKLAEVLGVRVGDSLTVEVLEGTRPVREILVADLLEDFLGMNAYMERSALNRLMREGPLVSGAYLAVDSARMDELYAKLKNCPGVAVVVVKAAALKSFKDTIAENLLVFKSFLVVFACIIAFGVVYNSVRITLAERARELATLRVIGFTRAEVSRILLGELAVLTVVAIPGGLWFGYVLAKLDTMANDTELFRLPLWIEPSTYGFAAVVTLLAALVSGLIVRRQIDRLDLVSVLKSKE
ncbi:MAG TPA: FtsX-like permease family protein [Gemmataceae bacterium]|jgi:putative ABC transport system permease protein